MFTYKKFFCIIIPLIISCIIFYLCCLISSDDVPEVEIILPFNIQIDKMVHFSMFFGLSAITAFTYIFFSKGRVNILKLVVGAFVFPILYGGLIEILQDLYFPPRTGDWYDFLADFLGSITALPFAFWFRSILLKKYSISG